MGPPRPDPIPQDDRITQPRHSRRKLQIPIQQVRRMTRTLRDHGSPDNGHTDNPRAAREPSPSEASEKIVGNMMEFMSPTAINDHPDIAPVPLAEITMSKIAPPATLASTFPGEITRNRYAPINRPSEAHPSRGAPVCQRPPRQHRERSTASVHQQRPDRHLGPDIEKDAQCPETKPGLSQQRQ